MKDLLYRSLLPSINQWLEEDDLTRNHHYTKTLPEVPVQLSLKVKSDLVLAGADYFVAVFAALGVDPKSLQFISEAEGKTFRPGDVLTAPAPVPFAIAVTAERLALNLLQHASSIATWTHEHVKLAEGSGIKILDTRKTTPGLRSLEKYAVRVGGGFNHRFGQADVWMIKDNHKSCLGGLKGAWEFFRSQGTFYNDIIAEIHDLQELKVAIDLGIPHVMLDNFSKEDIKRAVAMKTGTMTIEVSGGIKLATVNDYLIPGVDVLSIGGVIHSAPRVDLSLKYRPV